jgi:serine/threonine-protein kinase RsbW
VTVSESMSELDTLEDVGGTLDEPDGIELKLGARLENLPVIRSLAANLAIRADFDLDSIADLRLAVDEACSTLITHAAPKTGLICRFAVGNDQIRFTGLVRAEGSDEPARDSFGWQVLTTLTEQTRSNLDGGLLQVEFVKRKPTEG